jgi:hypothetical protein
MTYYLYRELNPGAQMMVAVDRSHGFPRNVHLFQALYVELITDEQTLYDETGRPAGYVSELTKKGGDDLFQRLCREETK